MFLESIMWTFTDRTSGKCILWQFSSYSASTTLVPSQVLTEHEGVEKWYKRRY